MWRKLFRDDHDLAGDRACKRWAWIDLCQAAAFRDANGLRRGEVRIHYPTLAERWGWTYKEVRGFIAALVQEDRIVPVTQNRRGRGVRAVYRIVTYDDFQTRGGAPKRGLEEWQSPF